MDLKALIEQFFKDFNKNYIICNKDDLDVELNTDRIGIYNEFSLQFELGMFLRSYLDKNYVVEFERNVKCFKIDKSKTIKKELDIVVFNKGLTEKYAIELKFPRYENKKQTKELDDFDEDEACVKVLVNNGFNAAYQLVLTDNPAYYEIPSNKQGAPIKVINQNKYDRWRSQPWVVLQGSTKYYLYENKGN